MKKLYPLKFYPALKEIVWGGSALVERFGRTVPVDEGGRPQIDPSHIAESWDVSGMDEEASVVSNGFLADNDLPDILETYMGDLVGDDVFERYNLMFPLLLKTLDVEDRLSVQVHPDDGVALERYDSLGKTEFWYIMEASEDAEIYMGFKDDVTATQFYDACKNGTAHELLNVLRPQKGDCFFIKPGTVHAATGGIIVLEIQESSNMTFRLYDWGRENNPQTARPIHLGEALDIIDFSQLDTTDTIFHRPSIRAEIARCDQFVIESIPVNDSYTVDVDGYGSFLLCVCTEGSFDVEYQESSNEVCHLGRGESIMLPASMDEVSFKGAGHLIQVYVPHLEESDDYIDK